VTASFIDVLGATHAAAADRHARARCGAVREMARARSCRAPAVTNWSGTAAFACRDVAANEIPACSRIRLPLPTRWGCRRRAGLPREPACPTPEGPSWRAPHAGRPADPGRAVPDRSL